MSSSEKSRNKDIMSFHRLCKDLYKFIQKRIIKKYVNPQIQYEPNDSLGPIISKNKEWKYYNTKEKVTEKVTEETKKQLRIDYYDTYDKTLTKEDIKTLKLNINKLYKKDGK